VHPDEEAELPDKEAGLSNMMKHLEYALLHYSLANLLDR
jgi:hypothetical protein